MGGSKQIILPVVLNGNNFLLWSRTAKTALRSQGLWEHIISEGKEKTGERILLRKKTGGRSGDDDDDEPDDDDEESRWEQADQLVLAILQSSLEPPILSAYSYSETAKELWDTLQGVYGNLSNISRIFEVKRALSSLHQEGKSFKDVFGEFKGLWFEMEMLRPSTTDAKELDERKEQDQVFGLLLTLNDSFKDLIKHILRYEKLPSLNEVCMAIQKEEGSRGLFQGMSDSAHVSRGPYASGDRKAMVCDHCKMKGHTKDKCWTLYPHLRPARLKNMGQTSRDAGGVARAEDGMVRRSEFEALIKSISKLTEPGKCLMAGTSQVLKPIIIDSGATSNMISDSSLLSNIRPYSGSVNVANGEKVMIEGVGDLNILNQKTKALYLPHFTNNLLSVSKTTKELDCLIMFGANGVLFQDNKTKTLIGEGKVSNGLYTLGEESVGSSGDYGLHAKVSQTQWHERFGHPQLKMLKLVAPDISGEHEECEACILGKHCRSMFPDSSKCYDECFDLVHTDVWTAPYPSRDQYKYFISFIDEKSKYTWITLLTSKGQAFEAFSRFHSYVSTQYGAKIKRLRSDNGGEYVNGAFKEFLEKKGIVHQTTCPYTPQQNGVAERKNRHLLETARAIMFARGVPNSFWGDAVMTAGYLINRLPSKNLDNQSPYEVLNKSKPSINHLRVFGSMCFVFVPEANRNKLQPKSMKCMFVGYSSTQKGYKCYSPDHKRIYVSRDVKFHEDMGYFQKKEWNDSVELITPLSPQVTNTRIILDGLQEGVDTGRRPIRSMETNAGNEHEGETSVEPSEQHSEESKHLESEGEHEHAEENEEEEVIEEITEPPLRRSTRVRYGPENWRNTRVYYNNIAIEESKSSIESGECSGCTAGPIGNSALPLSSRSLDLSQQEKQTKESIIYPIEVYCSITNLPIEHQAFVVELDKERIPRTYEEALEDQEWVNAINEELDSMKRNGTWEMVELSDDKRVVGCRWVFTIKYTSTGAIERYKARLVAKGYTQVYGEDYTETFAPVAKLHSVRVLLSVAINKSWSLWQMDVKNAFLQGDLEEEVFMEVPEGVTTSRGDNSVCLLKKAIYGLKQSPRAWYQRLSNCLTHHGFTRSEADHSLFVSHGVQGTLVVLIYVDDIIITGDDKEGIQTTKEMLKKTFDIKDLGELKYFLGIEMVRSNEGMFISQRKYTLELLSETGKLGCRPAKTPLDENYKEEIENEPWPEVKQYQRLVGRLIYLTITRPDICFAVNQVSKHMQTPTYHHWYMIERILRYLKSNPGKGIWLRNNNSTTLVGYCDADWAGDRADRKSTTGYCTLIGGNLVTWKSKKQKVVSLSSAEAEYRAMKEVTKELIWLKRLLKELGAECNESITLFCDNKAALHIASNPVFHERTKHIEVDCHFVREKVQDGTINPLFVRSEDQYADIFTKAATTQVCNFIHGKIGLIDPHQPILRGNDKIWNEDKSQRKQEESSSSHRIEQAMTSQEQSRITRALARSPDRANQTKLNKSSPAIESSHLVGHGTPFGPEHNLWTKEHPMDRLKDGNPTCSSWEEELNHLHQSDKEHPMDRLKDGNPTCSSWEEELSHLHQSDQLGQTSHFSRLPLH